MGWRKDIRAIKQIARLDPDGARLGVIEMPGGAKTSLSFSSDPAILSAILEQRLEGCPRTARVAVAYTESAPSFTSHDGAWLDAAQAFTKIKIAAVVVFEQTAYQWSAIPALSNRCLLDMLPDAFWQAELPVFFDENDRIRTRFPDVEVLERDSSLAFEDLHDLPLDTIVSPGCWTRGTFPVFDASATVHEAYFERQRALSTLHRTNGACFATLAGICGFGGFPPPDGSDPLSIASVIEHSLPDSVDIEALEKLSPTNIVRAETAENAHYAIVCKSASEPYETTFAACDQMRAACQIIKETFDENHVLFNPPERCSLEEVPGYLAPVLAAFGASHKLDAVKAGVPVEDVIA